MKNILQLTALCALTKEVILNIYVNNLDFLISIKIPINLCRKPNLTVLFRFFIWVVRKATLGLFELTNIQTKPQGHFSRDSIMSSSFKFRKDKEYASLVYNTGKGLDELQ